MEAGKSDALFIFIAFLHHTCVTELHACMRQTARGQVASSIVDSKRLETVSVILILWLHSSKFWRCSCGFLLGFQFLCMGYGRHGDQRILCIPLVQAI